MTVGVYIKCSRVKSETVRDGECYRIHVIDDGVWTSHWVPRPHWTHLNYVL